MVKFTAPEDRVVSAPGRGTDGVTDRVTVQVTVQVTDIEKRILDILQKFNIPFEEQNVTYIIYGYRER